MTTTNTFSATVLGLALAFSMSAASHAADNEQPEVTFDGGKLYENCLIDGGTYKGGSATYSCTIGGKTTVCDKNPADKNIACETNENNKRPTRGAKAPHGAKTHFVAKR